MTKTTIVGVSAVVAIFLVCIGTATVRQTGTSTDTPPFKEKWRATDHIDAPMDAYADPQSGSVYISLNPGEQDKKDGKERIAKLSRDGKMINSNWADGLNAPKGMRRYENTLWVADINELVGINLSTGKVMSRRVILDATSLTGVAAAPDGTVFASDFRRDKIYALQNDAVSVFTDAPVYNPPKMIKGGTMAQDPIAPAPRGITMDGASLVVGGWGQPDAHISGHLYALNITSKERTVLYPWPFANMDSLETDGKGGYIIADSLAGRILRFPLHGLAPERLQQLKSGFGQIGFVPSVSLLLVPYTRGNVVVAYDISDAIAFSEQHRR